MPYFTVPLTKLNFSSIFQLHRAPNTIKTGSKAIDNHCMKSTMSGEIGEMVNGFRQKRLQEYFEIQELCDLSGVALSRSLLEKGMNRKFLELLGLSFSDFREKFLPICHLSQFSV